jgi:hypothetical protein
MSMLALRWKLSYSIRISTTKNVFEFNGTYAYKNKHPIYILFI